MNRKKLNWYSHVFITVSASLSNIWFAKKDGRIKCVPMSDNVTSDICAERRFRSACAFAQSDQNLHRTHFGLRKLSVCGQWRLIRLRRCADWFESLMGAHPARHTSCGSHHEKRYKSFFYETYNVSALTLKAPSKNCSRRHSFFFFFFFFFFFRENKSWHFMWIVCQADEQTIHVKCQDLFSLKNNKKWRLLQLWLAL